MNPENELSRAISNKEPKTPLSVLLVPAIISFIIVTLVAILFLTRG